LKRCVFSRFALEQLLIVRGNQKLITMKNETNSDPKFKSGTQPNAEPALQELFLDCVRDIFWAENHLVKTLPKMAQSATSAELADAINLHLKQTKIHVERLEKIFSILGKDPVAKKCDAIEGITKEGEGVIESTDKGTATRDVGIILSSQKVEHYEIASYLGLIRLANTLGHSEVAGIFQQTLNEELETDQLLTEIATNNIVDKASEEA
jgi:ferritin-like metal-binding protein YciE